MKLTEFKKNNDKLNGLSNEQLEGILEIIDLKTGNDMEKILQKFDLIEARYDAKFNEIEIRSNAKFNEIEIRSNAKFNEIETRLETKLSNFKTDLLEASANQLKWTIATIVASAGIIIAIIKL